MDTHSQFQWIKKVLNTDSNTEALEHIINHVYVVLKQHESLEGDDHNEDN